MKTHLAVGVARSLFGGLFCSLVAFGALVCLHSFAQQVEGAQWERWETALREIDRYCASDRAERSVVIEKYYSILDLDPPREVELHVRLLICSRFTLFLDPALGEEPLDDAAVPLYEAIVNDFQDWPNHYAVMVAKVHLGDLYRHLYGDSRIDEAEQLYWDVVSIPESDIVFDNPSYTKLNPLAIAEAEAPFPPPDEDLRDVLSKGAIPSTDEWNAMYRSRLAKDREKEIAKLRGGAVKALARARTDPRTPQLTLERLHELSNVRPSDEVFQDAIEEYVAWFDNWSNAQALRAKGAIDEQVQKDSN